MANSAIELPAAEWNRTLRQRLLRWYRREKRDLPWRATSDPYRIWVSEIMLQQTQVATVIPYFERFLQQFPDVGALARASEQDVLRQWEGLGYYRRARQMHAAAQLITADFGGQFPRSFDDIRALPGVGRYTAGAIASFAFGMRKPALEANTIRLFSRLLAYSEDCRKANGQALLWATAEHVLPKRRPGEVNQALMELGSLICRPRIPSCPSCPVRSLCRAKALGIAQQLPVLGKSIAYEDRIEAVVVIRDRNRVLLRQCQAGQRWAGLWDFPRFHLPSAKRRKQVVREVQRCVDQMTGESVAVGEHLATIHHGVTRFRIRLECFNGEFAAKPPRMKMPLKWVALSKLEDYPLSATGRKIGRMLTRNRAQV